MTKVTYHLVSELPDTNNLVVGAIYYLTNGNSYLIGADKKIITISNLLKVDSLPITGDDSKLYLWVNNDKFNLYSWDGDKYIPMDIPDISQLELDIEDMGYTITNLTTNILTFAERLEEVQDNLEAHEKLKASETVLGHVKVDGVSINIDSDGVISSSGGSSVVIDNTITAQTTPNYFSNGHTISNVADSGFNNYFRRVTGGNLTGTVYNFIVDTYRYDDSDTTYKYYQRITIFVGDTFVPRDIIGYINRLSDNLTSWKSGTFESVNFYSEDGLFPIKYSIAGSTLNAIKENKKYISVSSTVNNLLTNVWVEDTSVLMTFKTDFDINDNPDSYKIGSTETYLSEPSTSHTQLLDEFNSYFGWDLTSSSTVFTIKTNKDKYGEMIQVVNAYYSQIQGGKLLGTLSRTSEGGQFTFAPWKGSATISYGTGNPSGVQFGYKGNLYYDITNGDIYKLISTNGSVTTGGWKLLVPKVVRDTFSPIEEDDDIVFSAFTVEQKLTTLDTSIRNDLNNHTIELGTNTSLGHVRADGTSIKSNNGVLQAKVKLNRIWESDPVPANAPTWTVDFSDEPLLTDLNNYDFEIYDDGVLIFGNPITHVVDNTTKTVTFTPRTPMPRPFTITCIGRGMEFY